MLGWVLASNDGVLPHPYKGDSNMGKKNAPGEESKDEIQLFTVAFNPKTTEAAFIGSMPVEQALNLIQTVLLNHQRAEGREEGLAEAEKNQRDKG